MQKIISITAIGAALLGQPAAAQAAEKTDVSAQYVSLAPSSAWRLDYSPESCNLIRTFGTGDEALTIKMEWLHPGLDTFGVQITGGRRLVPKRGSKLAFRFLPNGPETVTDKFFFGTGLSGGQRVTTIELGGMGFNGVPSMLAQAKGKSAKNLASSSGKENRSTGGSPPAAMDPENAKTGVRVQALAFSFSGYGAYRLELGSMEEPVRAVHQCLDDLLAGWGFDPAVLANLRSPPTPRGNPGEWITPRDYPRNALKNEQSASISFRLMVDAEGKVSGCAIANVNQHEEFSRITCELLSKRARFNPAIDANGNPTPSYYASSAVWVTHVGSTP